MTTKSKPEYDWTEDAITLTYRPTLRQRLRWWLHRGGHRAHHHARKVRAHHVGNSMLGGWWLDSAGFHTAAFVIGSCGTVLMLVAAFLAEEEDR